MKKEECDPEKQRKFAAITMTVCGIFIWLMSDSDKSIVQDLIKGIGIFLFIYGASTINKNNLCTGLTPEQKKKKMIALSVLTVLLIIGVVILLIKI